MTRDKQHYHPYYFILLPYQRRYIYNHFFQEQSNDLPTSLLDITNYDTFSNNLQLILINFILNSSICDVLVLNMSCADCPVQ